jgi:hypothetical protein
VSETHEKETRLEMMSLDLPKFSELFDSVDFIYGTAGGGGMMSQWIEDLTLYH